MVDGSVGIVDGSADVVKKLLRELYRGINNRCIVLFPGFLKFLFSVSDRSESLLNLHHATFHVPLSIHRSGKEALILPHTFVMTIS